MAFMHVHRPGDSHSHANLAAGFLSAALVATLVLVVAEFVGGYLGHSIALVSDAVHNLSDVPRSSSHGSPRAGRGVPPTPREPSVTAAPAFSLLLQIPSCCSWLRWRSSGRSSTASGIRSRYMNNG